MIFFRGQTIFQRSVISAAENVVLLLPGGVAFDCYVTPENHLDIFQFPQGCRNRTVIRLGVEPEKRLFQQIKYVVADYEGYELNKFPGVQRKINALFLSNGCKEPADARIAIDIHPL